VLATVSALFERLDEAGVRYCHWKSNWALAETLEGKTDLDLLVSREDASPYRRILGDLGFRPAALHGAVPFPAVEHDVALDDTTGTLVHVHSYYRVISGGSLVKNYHLPLEDMLLGDVRREAGINVPSRGAELIVFVLRMSLKHATMPELLLVLRDRESVRREATWLVTPDARAEAEALLPTWLPTVDPVLFAAALDALTVPVSVARRILVGRRMRVALRPYTRRGRVRAWLAEMGAFTDKAVARSRGSRKRLSPAAGGAVIAFVGPEATGKSTLLADAERWLGAHFTVQRVHAGKPPSTFLTLAPNLLLPALRSLFPEQRSTRVTAGGSTLGVEERVGSARAGRQFPMLFGIRSVLLAHDRRALLTRAYASAANGVIVLSDRYPSVERGAVDGAQLGHGQAPAPEGPVRRRLVALEARLYREIPPPDLVVYLTAPLEVALERNRERGKSEPESYVLSRHARSSRLEFERTTVHRLATDRPLDDVVHELRHVIWTAL
jgi:thymidylate kinase